MANLEQGTQGKENAMNLSESAENSEIILSVNDLHVWFELRRFGLWPCRLRTRRGGGVNFELRRGEAIAIVGESGCGKSSLMKTILGLNHPNQGPPGAGDLQRTGYIPSWTQRSKAGSIPRWATCSKTPMARCPHLWM